MTDHPVKRRKKMIEVAIPLEAINAASAREKSIRHGHPNKIHLWWAPRPLAAARAIIFAQMVDDPSALPEEFATEEEQENERKRLFSLISKLVEWESISDESVLRAARREIVRCWHRTCEDNKNHPLSQKLFNPNQIPEFHDPFSGGGALPLEAQRLGLSSFASDLNPVAVLIGKAKIEIPPRWRGRSPISKESSKSLVAKEFKNSEGLAADIMNYGKILRDKAMVQLKHLYPKVCVTEEVICNQESPRPDLQHLEGAILEPIAWLWARTVECPNPACKLQIPLISTFVLSDNKKGKIFLNPIPEGKSCRMLVQKEPPARYKDPKKGLKRGLSGIFECPFCATVTTRNYTADEAVKKRLGYQCLAVVAESGSGRVYLPAPVENIQADDGAIDTTYLDLELSPNPRDVWCRNFGLNKPSDLFTLRQLRLLTTLADLVPEAISLAKLDAEKCRILASEDAENLQPFNPEEYAKAIGVYLSLAVDKTADYNSSLVTWSPTRDQVKTTFGRQALPMVWDFAEVNPFASAAGDFITSLQGICKALAPLGFGVGESTQSNASIQSLSQSRIVSTDPPYYDNIGYADLSDFFYVWLRRCLHGVYPDLFATMGVPKHEELVATAYRHKDKSAAEVFFLNGMTQAMTCIAKSSHPAFPVTVYYAFKQAEKKSDQSITSTGWETFLGSLLKAGFSITGTWPIRTERESRSISIGTNALASSVVLVCQRRSDLAPVLSRNDFRRQLRKALPIALKELERANIAPVDVSQAAIGPGMAIFSSAKAVLNPDDSPMSVREALIEINIALDEYLSQDEGDLDGDSRFALTFFESYGYEERSYGDAEGLAIARNLSVDGVAEAGILSSVAGKVRLYQRAQLPEDWDPTTDRRLCVWEATQHLIKRLEASGEGAAAELLLELKNISGHGDLAANCRALAYRLYNHCEKKKQAEEARAYNGLVIAWPELEKRAAAVSSSSTAPLQTTLI